jgi:hypothetical protein
MAGVEARDFSAPDEVREPEKTTVELVKLAGNEIGRYTSTPVGGGRSASSPSSEPTAARSSTSGMSCPAPSTSNTKTGRPETPPQEWCTGSRPATTGGSSATNR